MAHTPACDGLGPILRWPQTVTVIRYTITAAAMKMWKTNGVSVLLRTGSVVPMHCHLAHSIQEKGHKIWVLAYLLMQAQLLYWPSVQWLKVHVEWRLAGKCGAPLHWRNITEGVYTMRPQTMTATMYTVTATAMKTWKTSGVLLRNWRILRSYRVQKTGLWPSWLWP